MAKATAKKTNKVEEATAVFEKKPNGTITFDLTIPAETIAHEYQKVLQEVAQTAQIKGFRPGKAPLAMVESHSDKNQLYSHVLDHTLSPAYSAMVEKHAFIPLIEPRVTPKAMEEGKDWVMAIEVATTPEVKLGNYEKAVKAALKKHSDHKHENEKEEADHKLGIVFDTLLAEAKLEVAPLLIEEETKSALQRLASQLSNLKLSLDDYAKSIKKTGEELVTEYRTTAESNLKLEFILQALIEEKKPEVTEADVQALKPPKGQEAYAKYVVQKRKVLDLLSAL